MKKYIYSNRKEIEMKNANQNNINQINSINNKEVKFTKINDCLNSSLEKKQDSFLIKKKSNTKNCVLVEIFHKNAKTNKNSNKAKTKRKDSPNEKLKNTLLNNKNENNYLNKNEIQNNNKLNNSIIGIKSDIKLKEEKEEKKEKEDKKEKEKEIKREKEEKKEKKEEKKDIEKKNKNSNHIRLNTSIPKVITELKRNYCDDNIKVDCEQAEKLFMLDVTEINNISDNPNKEKLDEINFAQKQECLDVISQRNSKFFEEEMDKLDKWAEDRKNSLQIELNQLNKDIKTRKTEARKIMKLEEKLKAQKEIKEMETKRNKMQRELFEAQDLVEEQKEKLIDDIEAKLKQKVEETELFTIRWRIV